MKKLSTKEFIKKAIEIHGNLYDYTETVYVDSNEKLTIICNNHKEDKLLVTPNEHLHGWWM